MDTQEARRQRSACSSRRDPIAGSCAAASWIARIGAQSFMIAAMLTLVMMTLLMAVALPPRSAGCWSTQHPGENRAGPREAAWRAAARAIAWPVLKYRIFYARGGERPLFISDEKGGDVMVAPLHRPGRSPMKGGVPGSPGARRTGRLDARSGRRPRAAPLRSCQTAACRSNAGSR
jgi:hypothetical protein